MISSSFLSREITVSPSSSRACFSCNPESGSSAGTGGAEKNKSSTLNDTAVILFFIDVNMPGLSGFDLLKQIRRQPKLVNIPLIILTSERTLSNNWRAQQSGCQFLSKPLSPEDIPQFKRKLRLLIDNTVA